MALACPQHIWTGLSRVQDPHQFPSSPCSCNTANRHTSVQRAIETIMASERVRILFNVGVLIAKFTKVPKANVLISGFYKKLLEEHLVPPESVPAILLPYTHTDVSFAPSEGARLCCRVLSIPRSERNDRRKSPYPISLNVAVTDMTRSFLVTDPDAAGTSSGESGNAL